MVFCFGFFQKINNMIDLYKSELDKLNDFAFNRIKIKKCPACENNILKLNRPYIRNEIKNYDYFMCEYCGYTIHSEYFLLPTCNPSWNEVITIGFKQKEPFIVIPHSLDLIAIVISWDKIIKIDLDPNIVIDDDFLQKIRSYFLFI